MPIIYDEALNYVLTASAIEIASAANNLQLELDSFLQRMGVTMSQDEIIALIEGSETSVGKAALDKFRNAVRNTLSLAPNQAGNAGYETWVREHDNGQGWLWEAQSGNPCPDCIVRDGQVKTLEEWDMYGHPKSGFSICGNNCKCHLVDLGGKNV